jgi:predicted SAM-dependent methyltransferase
MWRHRAGVRHAKLYLDRSPLKLNLGSGNHPKAGWVNVDLFAAVADLRLDLRETLPFPDHSVSCIHCEHFFEHLEYPNLWDAMGKELEPPGLQSEALGFLRECHRILAPGGTLDIIVPDAGGKLLQYAQLDAGGPVPDRWFRPRWADTPMHGINYMFRQGREHKYAYDEETLVGIIASVGFTQVRRRPFDPTSDAPDHHIGSLCVVGNKPL